MKYTFKLIPIIVNRLKFAKYIPTSFHLPTHEQLDQVIDILNDRDMIAINIAMLLKETEK